MIQLRPYQRELVDSVIASFNGAGGGAEPAVRSLVVQAGTGSGKTHTAAGLIEYATARGHRTLFLAHLDALIGDTQARLSRAGIRAGFVQADRPVDADAPVQVASLQTLHVRGERPPANLVILDECHRAMGASVRAILKSYPNAWLVGLTATPQRGDGKALGAVFQKMISGPSNAWLVDAGYLAPCDVLAPAEFSERALIDDPVRAYEKQTPGSRAIVFASDVAHAESLVQAFGSTAALIVGDTPRERREELRAALHTGTVRVLVGVGVFVEGWDSPSIETVILARPFTVTGSFLQAIGRGRRPSPKTGKTKCTVIDLRGSVHLHGLPDEGRAWRLSGKACVRTETMTALRRCRDCLAIFRPARVCPRCGAEHEAIARVPRVLRRAEKLERLNDVPQAERDRRYVWALVGRLRKVPKYQLAETDRLVRMAVWMFQQKFGRKPEAA